MAFHCLPKGLVSRWWNINEGLCLTHSLPGCHAALLPNAWCTWLCSSCLFVCACQCMCVLSIVWTDSGHLSRQRRVPVSRLVNITQSFESWKITGQFTNTSTRMLGLGSFLSTVQKQQDEGMHQERAPHDTHNLLAFIYSLGNRAWRTVENVIRRK